MPFPKTLDREGTSNFDITMDEWHPNVANAKWWFHLFVLRFRLRWPLDTVHECLIGIKVSLWCKEVHMLKLLSLPLPEGENVAVRPLRGRSSNPCMRCSKKRLRHLLTICRGVSNREAITSFERPCAAQRTIFARMTSLYGDVYVLDILSRCFRSSSLRLIFYGLFCGIITPFLMGIDYAQI